MRAPAFWWQRAPSAAALALAPLGWLYGAVTARRMARPGTPAPVPVVCVGNLVAGGAGKTPAAIAIGGILRAAGRRPVFLSRGYGGSSPGPLLVDPARHDAALCGDEPLLLAQCGPTVVSRDRVAGAGLAARHGDVIVMDDGLQNPSLAKDIRLAVVDGESGIGNGLCVPAGPLRAPLSRQWPHVDAVILVGSGEAGDAVARAAGALGKPVLRATVSPEGEAAQALAGQRILAFAGIGRPGKLFATLAQAGADVVATRIFPDHHPYSTTEARALMAEADALHATCWTTTKDRVRLAAVLPPTELDRVRALPVSLVFTEPAAAGALLGRISRGAPP